MPWLTVAFSVDLAATSGAMLLASGPDEAPEFETAWHGPVAFSQEPSEWEPRGSGDTDGSIAVAAEATLPLQVATPSQLSAAPATEADDGPAGIRAAFTGWFGSAKFWAAPGDVEAADFDCIWQVPPPASQVAIPFELRGLPPSIAPSQEAAEVAALPEQVAL